MERTMTAQAWLRATVAAGLLAIASISTAAQQTISSNDIQRLQDQVFQAGSELSRLRSGDASLASRLESDLDELREEVIYLKVKLRREGTVNRTEYSDLRDRLQELRARARGESTQQGAWSAPSAGSTTGASSAPRTGSGGAGSGAITGGVYNGEQTTQTDRSRQPAQSGTQSGNRSVIPVGQEIDVRLQSQLTSDNAQVEDRFEATTLVELYRGNDVLIPAGSVLRGVVSSVNRATRTDRKGQITLAFDQITVNGRTYPMRGTVTQALESEGMRGEAGRIGAGAGVGAIIGGIMGGVRGALLGVLIGGGGTIAATEGTDVTLPAGTILRVRLDTPPAIN